MTAKQLYFSFRQKLIKHIVSIAQIAWMQSGAKEPDAGSSETFTLPFNVRASLRQGKGRIRVRDIVIRLEGAVFLRGQAGDVTLDELSSESLLSIAGKLEAMVPEENAQIKFEVTIFNKTWPDEKEVVTVLAPNQELAEKWAIGGPLDGWGVWGIRIAK